LIECKLSRQDYDGGGIPKQECSKRYFVLQIIYKEKQLMASKELTVSRGEAQDPAATLKAQVEAQFAAALEKKIAAELTETPAGLPFQWEVYAFGPWQNPAQQPGRIIALGQTAYIATVVWMNPLMCASVAGFGADIFLSYWTSNTQTMMPVAAMDHYSCIPVTAAGGCFYVDIWAFQPTEAACLLETNICARLCNCEQQVVPGYAGFVRWVQDFDPETLWPAGPHFDHPIRYLVYNDKEKCPCPDTP
jgi:hypothetical protein